MRKPRMKDKMGLFLGLGILILCMLCAPALADYNYEGSPLVTVQNGIGDVYVNCGDHAGLNDTTWSYKQNTFVTNFTDVPTENITWAELKFGVWGGNQTYEGWANTTLSSASTDTVLDNRSISRSSPNPPVVGCGNGCWLLHYECTDELIALDSSTIKVTVNTNQISPKFDGRVYGAVLIVAYDDGSSSQYWINQGNVNLHKNITTLGIP